MINRAVSYQEFKAEEVCRLWDFELLLPVSHCGQYLNMEFVEQVSDLSGSDYDDEEEDLSLQPPLPQELTGKKWQEQILINAQRNLARSNRDMGGASMRGRGPSNKQKKAKSNEPMDPKSLEVWSKFFENAATLNQVKNGGTVNGLRVYRVPQVAGYEWPDLPSEKKFRKIVKITVSQPDTMIRDINLATSLLYATMLGDSDTVSMLLNLGADPNSVDSQMRSPAHYACKSNDPDMLDSLVEYGAELELKDVTGRNPLHIATVYGSLDAVTYLLESAVSADALDKEGNSSLHLVCHCGIKAIDISEKLLTYGADLSVTNDCGMTPMKYAEAVYEISKSGDLRDLSELFRNETLITNNVEANGAGAKDSGQGTNNTTGGLGLVQGILNLTLGTAANLITFATRSLLAPDEDGADVPPPPPPS